MDDSIDVVDLSSAPVPFFGVPRARMQVSTNGFLTFDTADASPSNYHPSSTPSTTDSNLVLAVFADDLIANTPGFANARPYVKRVAQGEDPFATAPHWIVQWHHVSYFTTLALRDDYNFQVKLFDDGVIEYHFGAMLSSTSSQYGSGASAITWLENATGTQALYVNTLSSNSPGISPRSAFRFVPR